MPPRPRLLGGEGEVPAQKKKRVASYKVVDVEAAPGLEVPRSPREPLVSDHAGVDSDQDEGKEKREQSEERLSARGLGGLRAKELNGKVERGQRREKEHGQT